MDTVKSPRDLFNKWQVYHKLLAELDTYRHTTEASRDDGPRAKSSIMRWIDYPFDASLFCVLRKGAR